MSPNTVRTHLQNLLGKLGVHLAIEAVALTRHRRTKISTSGTWCAERST